MVCVCFTGERTHAIFICFLWPYYTHTHTNTHVFIGYYPNALDASNDMSNKDGVVSILLFFRKILTDTLSCHKSMFLVQGIQM